MTLLYRPIPITSTEQAEALPIGTMSPADDPEDHPAVKITRNLWVSIWDVDDAHNATYDVAPNSHMIGSTVLVLIEAEDERDTAKAEKDQANDSAEDASYPLIVMQSAILTAVADALNGPPPPLTSWSHHDLGPKAVELVARAANADATLRRVRELVDRHGATDPDVLLEKLDLEVTGTPPVLRPRSPRTPSRPSIEMPRSPEETP